MVARVVMMAGGTGGHVFPALAVADYLRDRGVEAHWMGTERGIEARIVPENNIQLHTIDVAGIRGKSIVKMLLGPFTVAKAIWQARAILKKLEPQVVVGMGGYASGPGGVAARLLGIPLVVHEQNARAGSTNKVLAKIAQRVLTGFPNVFAQGVFVGNPVRASFYQQALPSERYHQKGPLEQRPFRLLVLGGSLGARALNEIVPSALSMLPANAQIQVKHQAGARTLTTAQKAYAEACANRPEVSAEVVEFISDVATELAQTDLVICRAGALTVAELAAVGVPSVLVPFPYAIDDHQTANASWLSEKGGAYLRPESELTAEALTQSLTALMQDEQKLIVMAEAAREEKLTATEKVADVCLEYLNV